MTQQHFGNLEHSKKVMNYSIMVNGFGPIPLTDLLHGVLFHIRSLSLCCLKTSNSIIIFPGCILSGHCQSEYLLYLFRFISDLNMGLDF